MVDHKVIDETEVGRILAFQESHFLDLKAVEISPAKLSESISALANTAGGELFVGIGENTDKKTRYWKGYANMEAANGLFQVIERMTPLGNHYSPTFLSSPKEQGLVLHLVIQKTKDLVSSTDGTIYVRRNAQRLRVTEDEALKRLRYEKGISTFEDETINVSIDTITNSVTTIGFMLDVVPASQPEDWIQKQNLIFGDKPIVAGLLLFADEPQAALPKRSSIKIYRYKTREEQGTRDQLVFDPITIEGSIYNQIEQAVARTKAIVEKIPALGEQGFVKIKYPDETLHEIITNAVLHRDYSIASDIHVRIFDNRIEVESPGRLPGHVTTDNLLKEQFSRNPRIVRLINKFPNPPNKDVGEGLNTAFEAMKKLRLKEPEVVESDHSVIVHIRHASLASPADAVMDYLKTHSEITNKIGRELAGITSENVMKDVFISLNRRKLLERVPGKKGNASAWQKYTGYWENLPTGAELEE